MAVLSSSPSTVVSAGAWTNVGNVYTSGNTYATNTGATQNTEYPFEVGGFDFASITTFSAVTVTVEAKASNASRAQIKVEMLDGTTVIATLALTTLTTADTNYTLAASPTLAQLKSANLKVRVTNKRTASQACTTSVDWVKIDVTVPNPKTETLTDSFDTSIDTTTKWPGTWGVYAWSAGRVALTEQVAGYSGIGTAQGSYDLTNSYVFAKLTRPPIETGSTETTLGAYDAGNQNGLWFILFYAPEQTPPQQVCLRIKTAGVTNNTFVPYDAVQHTFVRVRRDATNAYWDTSPDGITWTNVRTEATAINLSAVIVEISIGQWASETTQSTGYVDNVNVPGTPFAWPKIETLTDTFDTQVDKANVWKSSNIATVWDASGRAKIPCTTAYPNLATDIAGTYDLTGSSVFAKVTPATGASRQTAMDVMKGGDGSTRLRWLISGTDMGPKRTLAGVETHGPVVPYDPVAHAWLRIRESGGTAYFDTSPDSQTWTNRWSIASGGFDITKVALNILSGYYGTETAADTFIDNVNVSVGATTGRPKVWTGSAWAQKPVKVYMGAGPGWVEKPMKRFDGSTWKTV